MIVRIWEVKRVACYAMLGLKLLLRQLPRLPLWYSYALAITSSVCATRIRTEVLGGGALSFQNKIFVHAIAQVTKSLYYKLAYSICAIVFARY